MTTSPGRGSSRATIYAVAEAAGVSIATVSRVLSNPDKVAAATRERVRGVIADLDYVPDGAARSLAARSHGAYGLVVPELRGPYYAELLTGFEAAAARRGDSVVVLMTQHHPDPDLAVRRLAGRVDALVLTGPAGVSAETAVSVAAKVPVLCLAGPAMPGIETYSTESVASARALTAHLLDAHGRTRLRFVGSPERSPDVQRRYEGFATAHAERGLAAPEPVPAALSEADGRAVARRVADGDLDADALVCANDELALAVMQGLARGGVSVPGDVAVTGWDDGMAARYVTPGLTTVRQPVRELGDLAAERLAALLEDRTSPASGGDLPTELVIRGSCGCAGP